MNRDAELCFLFERHDRERKFCIVKKNAPINTFFTAGISVTIILCVSMNTVHKSFILLVFKFYGDKLHGKHLLLIQVIVCDVNLSKIVP